MKALEAVTESITPWLIEFGSWIFAGLIGFALIVIAPLVTLGPVETTILVSTVALALTLPRNLAGLLLLRLVQDMQRYEDKLTQGFHDASAILGAEFASPLAASPMQKRRTEMILIFSLGILTVSAVLTLIGLTAALWHVAWWIGILFPPDDHHQPGHRHCGAQRRTFATVAGGAGAQATLCGRDDQTSGRTGREEQGEGGAASLIVASCSANKVRSNFLR
jgi:hypothetical protein